MCCDIVCFVVQILDIVIDLFNKNAISLLELPSSDLPEIPSIPLYVSYKLHVLLKLLFFHVLT